MCGSFRQGVEWWIKCWILNVCFWFCYQLMLKSDLKEVQITLIRVPYSKEIILITWRCPWLQNSATVKKDNNNKYSKFNTNFNIWRPVQMTWLTQKTIKKKQAQISSKNIMVTSMVSSSGKSSISPLSETENKVNIKN